MKIKALAGIITATVCLSMGLCGCANPDAGDGGNEGDAPSAPNYNFSVGDLYAWVGYPASEITPVFENPDNAEALTFEYSSGIIDLDAENLTVSALSAGTVDVKVHSAHHETSFKIYCEEVDKTDKAFTYNPYDDPNFSWSSKPSNMLFDWEANGRDGNTTLVIGDSYFDPGFWTNFATTFENKDALCWGIGGSMSFTWESLAYDALAYTKPKNIVMHVGTNDVYNTDDYTHESMTKRVTSSLQRIFTIMHSQNPETNIYWFTITHRVYGGAEERYPAVNAINANMIEWGKGKAWMHVLDTNPEFKPWMSSDGTHQRIEHYNIFTEALEKAGIEYAEI